MARDLKTPEDILRMVKDDRIGTIECRFTDMDGRWRRCVMPSGDLGIAVFDVRIEADGASGRRLIPDPASAFLDPFAEAPTLVLICDTSDAATGRRDARDPRHIARKAEACLRKSRIGDAAQFGVEMEYVVFGGVGNGHIPVPPADVLRHIHAETAAKIEATGIMVRAQRHPVAAGKLDLGLASLTRMADAVMICRTIAMGVARAHGMAATFGDGGCGTLVHQSIWQGDRPLFAGEGFGGSSALMRHCFAGLREHAPALLAICAPADHARRHPSVACRVLPYSRERQANRVEFRCPGPLANPYLAFAAMLMAGIDGFLNRLYDRDPDEPIHGMADTPPQGMAKFASIPASLADSLDALRHDHAFLTHGDVFTRDVIETQLGVMHAPASG